MNKERRKAILDIRDGIDELKSRLEDVKSEEEEYKDNMPENMQGGDKYLEADISVDCLSNAILNLDDAVSELESIP